MIICLHIWYIYKICRGLMWLENIHKTLKMAATVRLFVPTETFSEAISNA